MKWWNWKIEKILSNAKFMGDAQDFLKRFYTPEIEDFPHDEIGQQAEIFRKRGQKIFSCVGDFRASHPLWRRIIGGYLSSSSENAVMFFFLGSDAVQADIEELDGFTRNFDTSSKKIIFVPPIDGKSFSVHVLKNSTHFITNREAVSSECIDWLSDTDAKIISALDDDIFYGEPPIDWKKFF